jgi:hypothetical protein
MLQRGVDQCHDLGVDVAPVALGLALHPLASYLWPHGAYCARHN